MICIQKLSFESSVSFLDCGHAAALCEEASSGSVWKQDVGRRTGHLPHAMEPLELICIGYVCVCLYKCLVCSWVSNEILVCLCVCVVVYCQFVRAYTCKCWVHVPPCLVKRLYITSVHKCVSVYELVPSPISCVGFFSRHSTMHGIPAGTVFSPPWKSQRQAARLSVSFSLSSASPLDLSALAVCGSISKHENGHDWSKTLQQYLP